MRTNVTVSVDADLLKDAKVLAARRGTSVSALLSEQLEELVRRERAYDTAQRRAVERLRNATDLGWEPPATRAEIHDR